MKKMTIRNTLVFLVLLVISGCKTFFEEDITNQTVALLSPATGSTTEIASQTFWWQKLEGDMKYRLQIVSPSFDSSEVLILDTLIASDKFTVVLYPSVFEWRVRAENSVWQTKWTTGELEIYSTLDLKRQKVNLTSPGAMTNKNSNRFGWEELYNAEDYSFVVYQDQWDGILAVEPTKVDGTFIEKELIDGQYVWGVKAENSTSESLFTQKTLIIDSTSPTKPILALPSDGSTVTNLTLSFSWNSSDLTSGIARDTLKIYADKSLTKIVKTIVSDSKNAEISFTDKTVYYWTVRSVDMAGNAGLTSSAFSFTVN
jgi:hypothetical protein